MCSIHGMGERWDEKFGRVRGRIELEPDTYVKIVRKGVIRYELFLRLRGGCVI